MKNPKLLGLALIAVLAAAALANASSASAFTFCLENTKNCPEGQEVGENTFLIGETHALNPLVFLNAGKVYVECHSTLLGVIGEDSPTGRLGLITSLVLTNCAGACKSGTGHSTSFLFRAKPEEHVFIEKDNEKNLLPGVLLEGCPGKTCLYQTAMETLILDISADQWVASLDPFKKSDKGECPSELQLDARWYIAVDEEGVPGASLYLSNTP